MSNSKFNKKDLKNILVIRTLFKFYDEIKRNMFEYKLRRLNVHKHPPNYLFVNSFNEKSVILDVGCGKDADFSRYIMEHYGAKTIGVDPTIKHKPFLMKLSKETNNQFRHLPLLVSSTNKEILFNESDQNESGSILNDHINVKNDVIKKYAVKSVTLSNLLKSVNLKNADYIKLDLEGAEYELLLKTPVKTLSLFNQIFIEFHHHCVDKFSIKDTRDIVNYIRKAGFYPITENERDYLFIKTNKVK